MRPIIPLVPRPNLEEVKRRKAELERQRAAEQVFRQGMASVLDLIAPAAYVLSSNYLRLGNLYVKTLFVFTYPRYLNTNWLSPIINFDVTMDISMHIYPLESSEEMRRLRKKATQLEASQAIEQEKGLVRNPELETAISDIEGLRDVLQRGELRLFQFALYFTLYARSEEEMETITKQLESTLGGMLVYTKQSFFQMEQGFNSTLPQMADELFVLRNLDTASLSTTFPFVSAELTSNEGVLYGLNRHNNSLILFDRFNLENANSVVFAKSGAGKSFAVKLEAVRQLMFGTDIIVIDPENEYKMITEAVGGSYLSLSLNSPQRINPFDVPTTGEGETGEDVLRSTIVIVHGLVSLMVGGLTPEEDSLLDRALYETYALKDITADSATHKNPPPLLTDLESVLSNMSGTQNLVNRLQKYTQGTFAGLFTKPTNFDLTRGMVAFSVRDLEESLRPIAMYMILGYVWNKIRHDLRRRIMIIDEAWWMMQYPDSAKFLYSLAKRARKYYLGLTIISQDVEDFLASQYGRAIINNSSLQLLLKQAPSAVDKVTEIFKLTEGEKLLLLESDIGQGLFFAGLNHVAIQVIASYTEEQLITTDPKELLARRAAAGTETPEQPAATVAPQQL
jgi:type IV secretory pathway VirB4 component